jgi:RimJ/RimL family protein N-acetyltransferase/GNAT superfamily N-acetyltransferase
MGPHRYVETASECGPSDEGPRRRGRAGERRRRRVVGAVRPKHKDEGSMVLRIVSFDPLTAGRSDWARFHSYRHARRAESEPDEPVISDAEVEEEERQRHPHVIRLRWLALDEGRVVGSSVAILPTQGSPGYAERARFLNAFGGVLGAVRRRGVGTRLVNQVHAVMCERAQTTLTMMTHEADGHAFLQRMGAQQKISNIESRLQCDRLDEAQLVAWEKAALASHQGLALDAYHGRVPFEVVEPLLPALSALHEDAPWGDLDHAPALLDISHYREWYRQLDRIGGAHHLVLLRESDGQLVGVSEAAWDPRIPERAWQLFTGVRRQSRRGGLAKCVKAALLRQVRASHPSITEMITSNASENAAMLAVNARIGFAFFRTLGTYQIERDVLGAWLSSRISR